MLVERSSGPTFEIWHDFELVPLDICNASTRRKFPLPRECIARSFVTAV
jgi:hypothetical protein